MHTQALFAQACLCVHFARILHFVPAFLIRGDKMKSKLIKLIRVYKGANRLVLFRKYCPILLKH